MILLWSAVFIVALSVLIKASDLFVDSAEKIGLYLGVPSFIIGVTIVATGTSLPELASSIAAVVSGSSEFVVGNVIGSNITNIFLVLAVAAVVSKQIKIRYNLMNIDMPLLVGSAFLMYFFLQDKQFHLLEALISILGLVIFLTYTIKAISVPANKTDSDEEEQEGEDEDSSIDHPKPDWLVYLKLIGGTVFVYLGAHFTVMAVSELAFIFNVGKEIVALTIVAFGTSVPELIVSAVAARKGRPEIAIGNVLGSNIFNTFAVMGIPALFGDLVITDEILKYSLPLMMGATFMFLITTQNKKVSLWEGLILLVFYFYYVADLLIRNFL